MKLILPVFASFLLTACGANMNYPVNFKTLQTRSSPNDYLVCPKGICEKPDAIAANFNLNVKTLMIKWNKMIANQPRIKRLFADDKAMHYVYVQRTPLFRFPDTIDVQFYDLGHSQSSLALYSRSKYGYSDLGMNKKRVNAWLAGLTKGI